MRKERSLHTLYIRADGNNEIGSGHIMRTLAIAHTFRDMGGDCVFITADHMAGELINKYKFDYICLNTKWNDLINEISYLNQIIKAKGCEHILFDTYFASPEYFASLSSLKYKSYIDDFQNNVFPVDLIIHYQINTNFEFYYNSYMLTRTRFCLGEQYAPLRQEFSKCEPFEVRDHVKRICITTGGTDYHNISNKILVGFQQKGWLPLYDIQVIIGKYYTEPERLICQFSQYKNITFLKEPSSMSEVFCSCDLIISAAGSTLYELCACGVPTIAFLIADNQEGVYDMEDQQLLVVGADFRNEKQGQLKQLMDNFELFVNDVEKRRFYSKNMQLRVDGKGAYRIAKTIMNHE